MIDIIDIGTIGTSLTANTVSYVGGFWQEALTRALNSGKQNRVRVYNVGAGGVTSSYGLANVQKVIAYRPKIILMEYMMNDCATSNSISLALSEQNHRDIVSTIRASLPDTDIYFVTMNPPIGSATTGRLNIESYNNIYRTLGPELEVGLIDTAPSWSGATSIDIPDGIHPTLTANVSRAVPVMVSVLSPSIE